MRTTPFPSRVKCLTLSLPPDPSAQDRVVRTEYSIQKDKQTNPYKVLLLTRVLLRGNRSTITINKNETDLEGGSTFDLVGSVSGRRRFLGSFVPLSTFAKGKVGLQGHKTSVPEQLN